jgi:hypothetical protein
MKRHPTVSGFCLALLVGVAHAHPHAHDTGLELYSARILSVSKDLISDIRPALAPTAAGILDEISVRAPNSWVTNASAVRGLHLNRVVEFNAGLLAVTDWLALAMLAEHDGHKGCLDEYSEYLVRVARKNSKSTLRGVARAPLTDFEDYALESAGKCSGAHADVTNERNSEFRQRILDGVITTVLLHEIAHHVLGHVDSTRNGFLVVKMRETAADQWAIRTASAVNHDLRTAVPLFLFLAASGGGTLEDDVRSSHPSGLRRIRDLLIQTRELMDEKDPVSAHVMDVSIIELNQSLNGRR